MKDFISDEEFNKLQGTTVQDTPDFISDEDAGTFQPIQDIRQSRIAAGQPVSVNPAKAKPSFFGGLVRDVVKAPARVVQTAIKGVLPQAKGLSGNYLGEVKPLPGPLSPEVQPEAGTTGAENAKRFAKGILVPVAVGTEIASNVVGGEGVAPVAKAGFKGLVKQAVKQGAKTGATSGFLYGVGSSGGNEDSLKDTIVNTIMSTLIGTGGGIAISGLGAVVSKGARTAKAILKPSQNDIMAAKKAIEETYTRNYGTSQAGKRKLNAMEVATEMKNNAGTEGFAPHEILADNGIVLKNKGNQLDTIEQANKFKEDTIKLNQKGKEALKEIEYITPKIQLSELEQEAVARARTKQNIDSGIADDLEREIRTEYAKLRQSYGEEIPITVVDDIKSARWQKVNFSKNNPFAPQADILKRDADYLIAKSAQKKIESVAEAAGVPDIAQFNRDIGDRFAAAKFLADLDGKTIKGSWTTKVASRLIGSTLGDSVAGKVLGALAGDSVADLLIHQSISPASKRLILRDLEKTNPASYQKILDWVEKQGLKREEVMNAPKLNAPAQRMPDPTQFNPDGTIKKNPMRILPASKYNPDGTLKVLPDPNAPLQLPEPKGTPAVNLLDPKQFNPDGSLKKPEVQVIPAQKNPVSVNPRTGKFQTSYNSEPQKSSPNNTTFASL